MLTFQDIYEEAQEQVQDETAASLVLIKRAINQGAKKFGAILSREWRVSEATFSFVADQQYYQLPEDAIRLRTVTATIGTITYPVEEIHDTDTWHELNMQVTTSTTPQYFFVKGSDEIGLWPVPSDADANAGTITYERRMRDMAEADYTTGTVTISADSAAVTGAGTTFTANMVGRYLNVTDGSADGMWYKISGFTAADAITLENNYGGTAAAGAAFKIAEIPDIPEEFHEALVDYACYRYYRRRRDTNLARDMKAAFDESLAECIAAYSSKTGTQYFRPIRLRGGYIHNNRNYSVTGS